MFRDVRDPELVELTAGELALDEVVSRGHAPDPLHLGGSRKTSDSRVVHEDGDEVHADVDSAALHQLGVNGSRAVGAARGDVTSLVSAVSHSRRIIAGEIGRRR